MNKIIKDAMVLFSITLVAGLGLGLVYNITSDARAEQEEKTKISAYEQVMPGMKTFEKKSIDLKEANKKIKENILAAEKENNIATIKEFNAEINEVVVAKDSSENVMGYIVTVTDNEAYGGFLQMTVGILEDKTVNGISFLSLNETPGLGMKAKEESFMKQFASKKVDFFAYNKSGAKADNEISAISSATITSNAVTHGVNAAIECVDLYCAQEGGAGNE